MADIELQVGSGYRFGNGDYTVPQLVLDKNTAGKRGIFGNGRRETRLTHDGSMVPIEMTGHPKITISYPITNGTPHGGAFLHFNAATQKIVRSVAGFLTTDFWRPGHRLTVGGPASSSNPFTDVVVASVTETEIGLTGVTIVERASSNDSWLVGRSSIVREANAASGDAAGSWITDGFTPGYRLRLCGFKENYLNGGNLQCASIISVISDTVMEINPGIAGLNAPDDGASSGNFNISGGR